MGRRRERKDMTVEQYERWVAEVKRAEGVSAASGEEGGPRVSFVPDPVNVKFMPPTDQVDELPQVADPAAPAPDTIAFEATASRKVQGWSAARQKVFIETLAETGTVHVAADAAGLTARSAYALRLRSPAFSDAWDMAQQLAVGRLSALAFERAIYGRVEQVYHDGDLVGERRVPSERLLMWLLVRLDPTRFAAPWERRADDTADPQAEAQVAFPAMLGALADTPAFTARYAALTASGDDAGDSVDADPEDAAPDNAAPDAAPARDGECEPV